MSSTGQASRDCGVTVAHYIWDVGEAFESHNFDWVQIITTPRGDFPTMSLVSVDEKENCLND